MNSILWFLGDKWRSRRKLLTNTFHFKILESYIPIFNKHSQALMKNLISESEKYEPIKDINSLVKLCSLDIVCGKKEILFDVIYSYS